MLCPSCGVAASLPTQKFCAECGTRLQQACPSCATPYEGSPKFCPECGFALQGGAPATHGAATNGAPTTATAETLVAPDAGSASTVAERKLVSVLFADLVGFTTMSETRDAEAVREQLTEYFGIGDTEQATGGYRDAIRQWRDIGAAFDLALCELDFVKFVGGENPDAKAAAEEAEGIFRRLGAPAFLQRQNDAVGLPVA